MKRIKIERLTEKDLYIPYENIIRVSGGPTTILIDYKTDSGTDWHVWLASETTMNWTRIDDDGSQVKTTLVTAEDFTSFVEFLSMIVKQNDSVKAIESL